MRHLAMPIAFGLVVACTSCSSCRKETTPVTADAAPPTAVMEATVPIVSAEVADATDVPVSRDAPWELVATQIAVRADGDTWMTARCEDHDGVYRRGRPQTPLAL